MAMFDQQDLMRNLLANCSTFQSEVGVSSKAAAKSYIHRFQALEAFHPAPRAVIRFTSHEARDQGMNSWRETSRLFLEIDLLRDIPDDSATALATQEDEVLTKFATIHQEIKDQQGIGEDVTGQTYLRVNGLNMLEYDIELLSESQDIKDPAFGDVQKVVWWMRWEVSTF